MKIQFIRSWRHFDRGAELEIGDGIAENLIRTGYAKRADVRHTAHENKSVQLVPDRKATKIKG